MYIRMMGIGQSHYMVSYYMGIGFAWFNASTHLQLLPSVRSRAFPIAVRRCRCYCTDCDSSDRHRGPTPILHHLGGYGH